MEIFNYSKSETLPLLGYALLLCVVTIACSVGVLFFIQCLISIVPKLKSSVDKLKNILICTFGILFFLSIISLFCYSALPDIISTGNNIISQKTKQYLIECGEFSIKETEMVEYRGEKMYYIVLTINGNEISPDNLFSCDEYNKLYSARTIEINYLSTKAVNLYNDSGKVIWESNATLLKIVVEQ